MTVCRRDQFTCESYGVCISMEERCDQFPNESSCQLVVLPQNYVPDYAPFTILNNGDMRKVVVSMKVQRFDSDDTLTLHLDWSDINT